MYCQKYSCRLSEQACRIRQTNKPHDLGCKDCEQGKEIMRRYKKAQDNLNDIEKKLAKKSNQDPPRKKRGRPPGHSKKKKVGLDITPIKSDGNKILEVNFKNHPELYNKILEIAAEELRSPENQALYILKNVL